MWPNERPLCSSSVAVNGVSGTPPGILDIQQRSMSCDVVWPHRAWEGARVDRVVMQFWKDGAEVGLEEVLSILVRE